MEIVHGSAVTIQALHSDVILHVPDGVYGIILGNIHRDHWRFRHLVEENDCIISPICEFFRKGAHTNERFTIEVPHILRDIPEARAKIAVKYRTHSEGTFSQAPTSSQMRSSEDTYFDYNSMHVDIHTRNLGNFFILAEDTNCCSKNALMLAFCKMEEDGQTPVADIFLYFASLHYRYQDYRQVNINNVAIV